MKQATKTQGKNTTTFIIRHPGLSLYLLHVPLGGALALPVVAGLAGGAEQQGGQFVHPLGTGGGRRHRHGRRCGAQPVIPPQHRPQHPRALCPPCPLRLPSSLPRCSFSRENLRPDASLSLFLLFLSVLFSLSGGVHDTSCRVARRRRTEPSTDVASPRLDADDDDDVRARPLAPDAGAYHRTVPRRVSDAR